MNGQNNLSIDAAFWDELWQELFGNSAAPKQSPVPIPAPQPIPEQHKPLMDEKMLVPNGVYQEEFPPMKLQPGGLYGRKDIVT